MNQDITILNRDFAIDGQISFSTLADGFIVADVQNKHCTASIALQGAHLLSWTPAGEEAVIWMSEDAKFTTGKSIRGGIPVCWPWFGAHGSEASFPAHGFARTSIWEITGSRTLDDGRNRLSFRLQGGNQLMWPYSTTCDLHFTLGTTLETEITTINNSEESIIIGQALHTYFAIGDIHKTSVHGLDGRRYLDKPDGFKAKQQIGPITFNGEVDRVYLQTADECLIEDEELNRIISIEKTGSASTIVWNPWEERAAEMGDLGDDGYKNMLCVESANAAEDVVSIAAGGTHSLKVRYSIGPLNG